MKKLLIILLVTSLLTGCSSSAPKPNSPAQETASKVETNKAKNENELIVAVRKLEDKKNTSNHALIEFQTPMIYSCYTNGYEITIPEAYMPIKKINVKTDFGKVDVSLSKEGKKIDSFDSVFKYQDMNKYSTLTFRFIPDDKYHLDYPKFSINKMSAVVELELFDEEMKDNTSWKQKDMNIVLSPSYDAKVLYYDYYNNENYQKALFFESKEQMRKDIFDTLNSFEDTAYNKLTQNADFKKIADEMAKGLKPDSTNTDKVNTINDWIQKNMTYDYDYYNKRVKGDYYNIEEFTFKDFLSRKKGICVDYSFLFSALARYNNVNNVIVLGQYESDNKLIGHAWNLAYDDKVKKTF